MRTPASRKTARTKHQSPTRHQTSTTAKILYGAHRQDSLVVELKVPLEKIRCHAHHASARLSAMHRLGRSCCNFPRARQTCDVGLYRLLACERFEVFDGLRRLASEFWGVEPGV